MRGLLKWVGIGFVVLVVIGLLGGGSEDSPEDSVATPEATATQDAAEQARERRARTARRERREAQAQAAARRERRELREERARVAEQEQEQEQAERAPATPPEGACSEVDQTNFEVPPGDERDADGDGIACESN